MSGRHNCCFSGSKFCLETGILTTHRFLLKYESRDEIQVLSRGNGGIVEVRNTIAEYDETSPLYGFLKYRRRSVIIKYLPEDCSRIIQGTSTPGGHFYVGEEGGGLTKTAMFDCGMQLTRRLAVPSSSRCSTLQRCLRKIFSLRHHLRNNNC